MKGTYKWLICAAFAALVLVFLGTGAQAGDVWYDDWEDGNMDLPDDLDGSSGDKDGWDTYDPLYYYYYAGWGMSDDGYYGYDSNEPYEGDYSVMGQLYGYNSNITMYTYIDLTNSVEYPEYSPGDDVWISFWYHYTQDRGYGYGPLSTFYAYVHDNDDNSWTTVWTADVTDDENNNAGDDSWSLAHVDISDYISDTTGEWTEIYFEFKTTTSGYASSSSYHVKMDNIQFDIKEPVDFAVDNITATPAVAEMNETALVRAGVRNDGSIDSTFDVNVEFTAKDSDGTTVDTQSTTIYDDLDVNEWVWVYFNFSDVSQDGVEYYDLEVAIDSLVGGSDADSYDDDKNVTIMRYWVKWWEDFETGDMVAPPPADSGWWVSEELDGYSDGGVGLSSGNHYSYNGQNAYEGDHAMIARVDYSDYDVSGYVSFDMTGWDNVALSFWYDIYQYTWSYYYNYYRAEVYASDDGGSEWVLLADLPRDQTYENWQQTSIDLSGNPDIDMTSNVTIRFRWRCTYSSRSRYYFYFMWDALMMTGDPFDEDVAMRDIGIPGRTLRLGDEFDLTGTIKNVGKDTVTPSVNMVVTDQWGNEVLNDTKSAGSMGSLWTKDVVWADFEPDKVTRYYLNATAVLATDEAPHNNYYSTYFDCLPLLFFEDFEDSNTNATDNTLPADSGWYLSEPYGDSTGYYDGGAGLTSEYTYSSYYDDPLEGDESAILTLASYYDRGAFPSVYMDVTFLDITYEDPLTLEFIWDTYGDSSYEALIHVSYDGGGNWTTLNDGWSLMMDNDRGNIDTFSEQLPEWTTAPSNLTIRFEFKTSSSYAYPYRYFKFDLVKVKFPLQHDLKLVDVELDSMIGANEYIPVDVTVSNVGYASQSDFDIIWTIYEDDGSTYDSDTETIGGPLAPGASETYSLELPGIWHDSGMENYTLKVEVEPTNEDQDVTNNGPMARGFSVGWFAFWDDFETGDFVAHQGIYGWNASSDMGDGYDTGAGLNTDRAYNYYGEDEPYEGRYCGFMQIGYSYSTEEVTADATFFVAGWDDLHLYFMYDTYASGYYSSMWMQMEFEIWGRTDGNSHTWVQLNGGSDLTRDSTRNNWLAHGENLSANALLDLPNSTYMTLRFKLNKTSTAWMYYYYNYFKFDNILVVGEPPATDAAVKSLDLSATKITAGEDVDITAIIKNAGSDTQAAITVDCKIVDSTGTVVKDFPTDTVTNLEGGEIDDVSWSWETDDVPNSYSVNVTVTLSGDVNPYNDKLMAYFETGLYVFYDGYEDLNLDATDNVLPADYGWNLSHRRHPLGFGAGVGITQPGYVGSGGMVMALEYGTYDVWANFTTNMLGEKGAKLYFWYDAIIYYTYYQHDIEVMVNNNSGSGWVEVMHDHEFQTDTTSGNWALFAGKIGSEFMVEYLTVQIRWRTQYTYYEALLKVDEFTLNFLPENDLSVTRITGPWMGQPGRDVVFNATVLNDGWGDQSNFDVGMKVHFASNGTLVEPRTLQTVTGTIGMFETTYVEFTWSPQRWAATDYVVTIFSGLSNDQDNSNNASTHDFHSEWFLFWEDFEGEQKLVATGDSVLNGWWPNDALEPQYTKTGIGRSDDGYNTRVEYGQYAGHAQLAYRSTYYGSQDEGTNVYMDVHLRSAGWTNMTLIFDYSWYASTYYPWQASVEVYNGTDWERVWDPTLTSSYDRDWYSSGDIDIPDYMNASNMTLRFRYENEISYYYQHAVYNFEFDNILITGVKPRPVEDDIGVAEIVLPEAGDILDYETGNVNITAMVGNYGNNTVTFTADVTCTNEEYGDVESASYVWPDDGMHTMDPTRFPPVLESQSWSWDPTLHGWYTINVTVTLDGGTAANTWNDYLTTRVQVVRVVLDEDFEDDDGDFTHWASHTGFDEWEWGRPTYSENDAGGGTVDYAHSGGKAWGTDLDSYYDASYAYPQEYLESPELDISSGYAGYLSFWHWYDCRDYYFTSYGYAGGNLKISTDGGANFKIIHPIGGYKYDQVYGLRGGDESNSQNQPGWSGENGYGYQDYSSGGWIFAKYDLGDYMGHKIVLRWQFGTYTYNSYDSPGWYIDDVRVWTFSKKFDLGVLRTIASNDYPAFDDVAQTGSEETRAIIQNNGLVDFEDSFDVTLDVVKADYVNLFEPYNHDIEDTITWYYAYPYYPWNYPSSMYEWTHYGYSYTGDRWEDGTPANVGPDTAHGGSRCLGVDIDGEVGGGSGYSYTRTDIQTPTIDVDPDMDTTTVSWWEYYETDTGHRSSVYIAKDNGGYNQLEYRYGEYTSDGWVQYTADISDVEERFRLRFYYYFWSYYYDYPSAPGWYLDDFEALQLSISDDHVETSTQTITDDVAFQGQHNVTWSWSPDEQGYYYYNVSLESDADEYSGNNLTSELKFIGKWFDVWDFEDTPHEEGFDTEDLSGYGDLWNIVERDNQTYFDSWSPYHSDYAWWLGYNDTERVYPHSPIGSMEGSYDLGMNNVLATPSVDLRYAEEAHMTFWHKYIFQGEGEGYNGDGTDDGGFVEVSTDGGLTWQQARPDRGYDGVIRTNAISRGAGYDAFMRSRGWTRETIDMTPYAGDEVLVRFRFTSYFYSDMYTDLTGNHGWYVDDMLIYGSEYEENTGIGHVTMYQDTYNGGTFVEDVEMTIHLSAGNLGTDSNEDVTVDMKIEDEDGYSVWDDDVSTDTFDEWTKKWTPSDPGTYTIYVESNAAGDENSEDNTWNSTFWVAALALYDDVEGGEGRWTHGGTNDYWHRDTVKSNSGDYAWYMGTYDAINETYTYAPQTEAALSSPSFDLRSFRTATMTWASWWSLERDRDGFNVEFSEDGDDWTPRFSDIGQSSHGVFWSNPTLGNPQTAVGNRFNLASFVGEQVFMRIIVRSDRNSITDGDEDPETPSGVFIDDITIFGEQYENNVGINFMNPPEDTHLLPGEPETFTVNVSNLGREDQSTPGVRVNASLIYASNGSYVLQDPPLDNPQSTTFTLESLESGQGEFEFDIPMSAEGEEIIFQGTVEIYRNGEWTMVDDNPADNLLELTMDVVFWHDIAIEEINVLPIVPVDEDVEMSATITNYGNVPENDFGVKFAVGDIAWEYGNIDGDYPKILVYNGYSTFDTALYYSAVMQGLENLGIPDAQVISKNRTSDGNLNQSNIDWADVIIFAQYYYGIDGSSYYERYNEDTVDLLADFLDAGGNLFMLGEQVTYYGSYYYYSYYDDFCEDYLHMTWTGYVYGYPYYQIDFTGNDLELSQRREWSDNDYSTYTNQLHGDAERLFTYDNAPMWVAAGKFNGTEGDSEPFKVIYSTPCYYRSYMRGGDNSYNNLDQYEVDLMTNVLNWFIGERTLNISDERDSETVTIDTEIEPGETREVSWTWDQNPPDHDDYTIAVINELPGDNMTMNDYMTTEVKGRKIVFQDDFEEGTVKFPDNGSTEAVWSHYGNKDQWRSVSMSWHEGEEDEINLYRSEDHAWWCGNPNTTQYVDNSIAYLESPVLNLTTMAETSVSFWLRFAAEYGHDYMQVFVDTPDLLVPEAVSDPFTGYNLEWEYHTFDISEYTGGEAQILFLFFSDANGIHEETELWLDTGETWSGSFVDDIMVYGIEYDYNLAPKITAPANETVFFMEDMVEIDATLTNRGTQNWLGGNAPDVHIRIYDETNDPGTYEVDTTLQSNVEILSGATRNLNTYPWQAPVAENVTYRIEVYVDEALDESPADDVFARWIEVRPRFDAAAVSIDVADVVEYGDYPNVHITYENLGNKPDYLDANVSILKLADDDLMVEDLDPYDSDNWTESEDELWVLDSTPPQTNGFSMHGNSPHQTFLGTPGVTTWTSPEIDLGVSPTPLLSFKHVYNIESQDGALVRITVDGGETWEQLTPAGGYPATTSISTGLGASNYPAYNKLLGEWTMERYDLANYFGTTVQIQFVLAYDGSYEEDTAYPSQTPIPGGWFIDNITVSGNNISDTVAVTSYESSELAPYGQEQESQDWDEWQALYGQYFIRLEVYTDSGLDENLTNNVVQTEMAVANILFHDDGDTYQEPGWSRSTTLGKSSQWQPLDPDSDDDDDWTTFGAYDGVAWWCGDEVAKTYENNLNNNLTTRSINMVHTEFVYLRFYHKHSFKLPSAGYDPEDKGIVEVANVTDRGVVKGEWHTIRTFDHVDDLWHKETINVSGEVPEGTLDGKAVFRFRMYSGSLVVKPQFKGWFIDDIIVFGQPFETNVGIESTSTRWIYSAEETYDGSNDDHPVPSVDVYNYGTASVPGGAVTVTFDVFDYTYHPLVTDSPWLDYAEQETTIGSALDVLGGTTIDFTFVAPTLPTDLDNNTIYFVFTINMTGDMHSTDDMAEEKAKVGKMMAYWDFEGSQDDAEDDGWVFGSDWQLTRYRSASGNSVYGGDNTTHQYGSGWRTHLESPMVYLTGVTVELAFWHKYDFNTSDYAYVYIFATDDPDEEPSETDWDLLAVFQGSNDPVETLDLSDYSWMYVKFRFTISSNDDQYFGEGWYLDDVAVYGLEPYAAGHIAPNIRHDYLYPNPDETNSELVYEGVEIGNLGSNSDTILWSMSIRSRFRFTYVYNETDQYTARTTEETDKGLVWFDALNWTFDIYDTESETYVVQDAQISDQSNENSYGERVYNESLVLPAGDVRHWTITVRAADEDHFHMIDAWKGTYWMNMSATSIGADATSEFKTAYAQLTPEILPPDVALDEDRWFFMDAETQVLEGETFTAWLLIPNEGTYMHNARLSVWITAGKTGVTITGPSVTGNTTTVRVTSGEKAEFYIGAEDLVQEFGTGNDTELVSVLPPSVSNETPYEYKDDRFVLVPVTLANLPLSARTTGTITINFEIGAKEYAESPVAAELAEKYAENNDMLPDDTPQYEYDFVEIRAHLEDSRQTDNTIELDVQVVKARQMTSGFSPAFATLAMAAVVAAAVVVVVRRKSEED